MKPAPLTPPATLHIEDQRSTLSQGTQPPRVLAVGARGLAEQLFRHDPPRPQAIERAIDLIEDALAASGSGGDHGQAWSAGASGASGVLWLRAPGLTLPALQARHGSATREAVETEFQRLAQAAVRPGGWRHDPPLDGANAAALVILRECMHHLGFEVVHLEHNAVHLQST